MASAAVPNAAVRLETTAWVVTPTPVAWIEAVRVTPAETVAAEHDAYALGKPAAVAIMPHIRLVYPPRPVKLDIEAPSKVTSIVMTSHTTQGVAS